MTARLSVFAVAAVAALVAGCKKPSGNPKDGDGTTDTETTPPTDTAPTDTPPTETASTGDTAATSTGDTGTVVLDCAALMQNGPVSAQEVVGARGYHDVAFDMVDLEIIGSDGNNLIQADFYGSSSVFAPGTGTVQGIDRLPNGDFVAASDSNASLLRVTPAGASSVIVGSLGAYSVVVGPDGMVYTANYSVIERIDPDTGERETLVENVGLQPRVIAFGRDYTKLFVGTLFGTGAIYAVDLDANLDPISAMYVYATGVGNGNYHDAIAVDYCDNLYVSDFSTGTMYRIEPDGTVTDWLPFPGNTYGHGARFGHGLGGGWRIDAMYVPQPYNGNTVSELVIGIPSAHWDGTGWP